MNEQNAAAAPPSGRRFLDWKSILGLAISAGLLYWVFKDTDFRVVLADIRQADPLWLAFATFCATFVFWIRAWRWKVILEPSSGKTSFHGRFAATTIGFMGNNLLPARVGEFMRAFALSRVERVPIVSSFSSLVLERLLDAVFIISSLFISMTLPGFPGFNSAGNVITASARAAGTFVFTVLLLLAGFVIWPTPAVRITEKILSYGPAKLRRLVVDSLEAFLAGAGILRNPRLLLGSLFWTCVLWGVNAIGFWAAFRAFDIELNFTAAIFFQAVIALGVSIPSAPGFFGTFETFARLALVSMWGVTDVNRSNAFAIAFHICGFIPVTLIGLYYARRIGMSLRDVEQSEEAVEEAVEEATGGNPAQATSPTSRKPE